MIKSMILKTGNINTHYVCPNIKHWKPNKGDKCAEEVIPHFYSEMQAIEAGWERTDDPLFCPPDEEFVWVCPKCADKL